MRSLFVFWKIIEYWIVGGPLSSYCLIEKGVSQQCVGKTQNCMRAYVVTQITELQYKVFIQVCSILRD